MTLQSRDLLFGQSRRHVSWAVGLWAECCSSNSNAPDFSQKGLIGIHSHHSREKMSKKAREKPAEAGSASVSPYGSVLGYELVTSQPNRLINLIWPECRTWFIGPCSLVVSASVEGVGRDGSRAIISSRNGTEVVIVLCQSESVICQSSRSDTST